MLECTKPSHVLNMSWLVIMRSHAIFILFLQLFVFLPDVQGHSCNIAATVITAQHFCGTKRRPPLDLWIARKRSFHLLKVRSTILQATRWASLKSASLLLTGLATDEQISTVPKQPSLSLRVLGLLTHGWVAKDTGVMHAPRPPCNCDQTLMIVGGWLLDNLCGMHIYGHTQMVHWWWLKYHQSLQWLVVCGNELKNTPLCLAWPVLMLEIGCVQQQVEAMHSWLLVQLLTQILYFHHQVPEGNHLLHHISEQLRVARQGIPDVARISWGPMTLSSWSISPRGRRYRSMTAISSSISRGFWCCLMKAFMVNSVLRGCLCLCLSLCLTLSWKTRYSAAFL